MFSTATYYNKALDWMQFTFTWGRMGDNVAPDSTSLACLRLVEVDPILIPAFRPHQWRFPGEYAPLSKSMSGPLWTNYLELHDYAPTERSPERR